ncbi:MULTISPECIES: efflux transporter outer membrane subunit [unclassified Rhizobacter]|uniref:efflux transporter outer membrane subunit n=1 Tax=unclassified Rhizobacter TaxID=2640088 RepID=UPI0006F9283F|nr:MULTISPECIES: efflux transporter outer membrane subunit [unclassified Rhizobacter]KQU78366.1 RND transporter [Rhizobacter sp. Root29]KQW10886.1 RND transporter [Rhizobacter sp. Root1238]KRB25232.1 RND transporter [Rhizobacter sp. Root16D2]
MLRGSLCVVALALSACAAGPDYRQPKLDMPVSWQLDAPWREATPDDAALKGPWWQRFGDAQLDALAQQALAGSPTLAAAAARLAQARAVVASSSSSQLPQLTLNTRDARQRISANRPLTNYNSTNFSTIQNDFTLSLAASYEVDLAGRVQRSVEGARASAEQSAADFENTRLLLTAELAVDYFSLRALDTELDVLTRSIALQRRSLELVTARRDLGAASGLDVAQQQALLDTTLTQVDVLRRQRAQFEHAIATLTGTPAPLFSLAPAVRSYEPPAIPLGVPSDVLQRRPDVAAAERAMAAANAQIGVASAAFYPSVLLGPSVGYESRDLSSLFNAPSLLWSIGVSATQSIFDGGRVRANIDFAKAGYDLTVANYRRTVLTAMQEVEDGITGLAALDRASTQAQTAVASARRVLDMATSRYEGGASTYFDVITAQQSLLASERQAAQLLGQRQLSSVFLVKALGGDWQRGENRGKAAGG